MRKLRKFPLAPILGNKLRFRDTKNARRGDGKLKVYHCAGYKECPKRWQCSSNKRGRTIELSEHHEAVARQRTKQKDDEAKAKLARRGVIVEPTFAHVKCALEFRRWSHRYLEANRSQWSLICSTINLHKLYAAWLKGAGSRSGKPPPQGLFRTFFGVYPASSPSLGRSLDESTNNIHARATWKLQRETRSNRLYAAMTSA